MGRHWFSRLSHSDHVIVDALGRLDAPVAQPVAYVVECLVLFNVHHPVGYTVSECVWRYIVRVTTPTVDEIRFDDSGCNYLRDEVPDALRADPVARP